MSSIEIHNNIFSEADNGVLKEGRYEYYNIIISYSILRSLLPLTITSSAGDPNWVIRFGPLVTFCVLIDYLANVILPKIGATTLSFDFFLSFDDALFLIGLLILFRFNLVESNGIKNALYGSRYRPSISFSYSF